MRIRLDYASAPFRFSNISDVIIGYYIDLSKTFKLLNKNPFIKAHFKIIQYIIH